MMIALSFLFFLNVDLSHVAMILSKFDCYTLAAILITSYLDSITSFRQNYLK